MTEARRDRDPPLGLTRRSVQRKPTLLLLLIALGLAGCAGKRVVQEPEEGSTGPTIYGTISVSVDQVTTR